MKGVLLSTAYFPPVKYFSVASYFGLIYLEQFEHFNKQTYRNRCEIMAANGPISLIVPVVKGRGAKTPIRDLQISYDTDWQRNHWRTIFSAYSSSPFFEYYADEIFPFFNRKYTFLFDFNLEILNKLVELTDLELKIAFTDDFEKTPGNVINMREEISPKSHRIKQLDYFIPQTYTQVFSDRMKFHPDLSVLDLLFNTGPDAVSILEKSIRFPDEFNVYL